MTVNSNIEWTDATFNPWEGCQKVGPGCDHCYAETRNKRFGKGVAINWGPGAPRRRTSTKNWKAPRDWNDEHNVFFAAHGRRRRVFCASLADVFDNAVPREWRDDLAALILDTPNLDWLLLTKRIGNAAMMLGEMFLDGPPPNIRIGATIVNQKEADHDIAKLRRLGLPNFLSIEPLLGSVVIPPLCDRGSVPGPNGVGGVMCTLCNGSQMHGCLEIDWVIVGGESGPGARPMYPDWARGLRDQCAAAGVPFLFKQHGEWVWVRDTTIDPDLVKRGIWVRRDGATHDGTRDDQFSPDGSDALLWHVGKKAAGRLLDGRTWDGYPL